jgi:peptidoglycan LD-endopeptidase LytH
MGVDSSASTPPPPQTAERMPGRAANAPATGPAVSATTDELAALSAGLGVPVAGVARSALRDSYTEPRGGRLHEALDIIVPRGTPVLSAADGTLLKLFDSDAGGLMVYAMDVSERFILLYGHLDGYADGLTEGMPLARGQVIGHVGTTGNAPGGTPHLHFEILRGNPAAAWWVGVPVNPYPLLVP